jgi:glyoxylase-like metal-dependent hydrolase (beta-lactamase superfamily II)
VSKIKQYFILEPAKFRLDGGAMYGIIPKPLWQKKSVPDQQNRINLALRLLLIKTENSNILIDTGIGDYHDDKFISMFDIRTDKGPLRSALKSCDLMPSDITDLIISHLHFDHVGGICERDSANSFTPVFKNATLHLHKEHYQYALSPTIRDAGSFQSEFFVPLIKFYETKNKINWLSGESGEIIPDHNINFKCSWGHTPFLVHPFDEKFIYITDLIPTSNHVKIPWVMGYDIEPGVTTVYKEKFLDFILKRNLNVIYEHDEKYWGSQIVKNDKGQMVIENCRLAKDKLAYQITFD